MNILVTGGTGFIGSHTCVELLENSNNVIIVDNLSNSKKSVIRNIETITGKKVIFYECDILDYNALNTIFQENNIDYVIHFAGLKAVGESNEKPLQYYYTNVSGTINLLNVMKNNKCKDLIFSSSATIYGNTNEIPINEDCQVGEITNPYGRTKLIIENILKDLYNSDNTWNIIILRYFNPIGAHPTGLIGENPNGIPNNLVPYITQVALGKLEFLRIFGNDYETKDGTGVRDYIHVCDLAQGHLCALNKLKENPGLVIYNLGTGVGYSVFEVLHTFEEVVGKKIPFKIEGRRKGDIPISYTNPNKAYKELGFKAKRNLYQMCKDQWNWQINLNSLKDD